MNNKLIIEELKNLTLSLQKIKDGDDDKFINLVDQTKIYVLGLLVDKEYKDLRKETINQLEECTKEYIEEITTQNSLKKNQLKNKFKNLLKSLIKVLEDKEDSSGDKKDNIVQIRIVDFSTSEIDIKKVIQDTLEDIELENKTEKEKKEARQKLDKLEKELEEPGLENRKTIKGLIKRFADFSQDVFITLLPAIIKYDSEGKER